MKKLIIAAVLSVMFTVMSIGSASAYSHGRDHGGRDGYRRMDDRRIERREYREPVRTERYGYHYDYRVYDRRCR